MSGFAIIDHRPHNDETAIWLTNHVDGTVIRNTNAVVIQHDDPDYSKKVRSLTAYRWVVLTEGSEPPLPFAHAVETAVFDVLIASTARLQDRIGEAIAEYAERHKANLVVPTYLPIPQLPAVDQVEARFRALAVANYIGAVWSAWLFTEEHRLRRTVAPKTRETPWIMPPDLNSPTLATLPAEFADRVKPEPLS
ncbi:hypothetical protein ACFTS5_27425 [Nocardia sp. NPDC056952]|uniref:hypothetical protein n=1 Tax=Nocardia sp. NPDC056952 TaxID=3345979 RepID=UPI00363598A8